MVLLLVLRAYQINRYHFTSSKSSVSMPNLKLYLYKLECVDLLEWMF